MNEIISSAIWSPVRLLEKNEFASGGVNGNMNEHAIALANRTHFLKEIIDELKDEVALLNERVENCNCSGEPPSFPTITDENISDHIDYSGWFGLTWMSDIEWHLEVDGVLYKQTTVFGEPYHNTMDGSITQIIWDHNLTFLDRWEDSSGGGSIYLNTAGTKKIRFIPQSLATQYPNKYPTPVTENGGAIPIVDQVTKIWSFILRKNEE